MQHMVSLVKLGVGLEECVCWWRVAVHHATNCIKLIINSYFKPNARYNHPKFHDLKYYPLVQHKNIAFRMNNLKENRRVSPLEGKMCLAKLFI
jgi:hypothetical protein